MAWHCGRLAGLPACLHSWREATLPDEGVCQSSRRRWLSFATRGPSTRTTRIFINLAGNPQRDARDFSSSGRVVGGMDGVDRLYAGYGEPPPQGRGPVQERILSEGNVYLEREFPQLDRVLRASIVAP